MEDLFDRIQAITGISKYSNAEVITPKAIVADMVDLLPVEVFAPDSRFLDPAVKSGRFLAELYRRLMASPLMVQAFPDEQDRQKHILDNQLYGLATSPVAATVTRKALYDDPTIAGNIVYVDRYLVKMADKTTDFKKLVQGEFGENMKFDVVIGNPPYQEPTDGGSTAKSGKPLYTEFVIKVNQLKPKYMSFIIPTRWYTDTTREASQAVRDILLTSHTSTIVDIPNATDVFPSVQIAGGVMYFLKGPTAQSRCKVRQYNDIHTFETELNTERFIRYRVANSIDLKIKSIDSRRMTEIAFKMNPFGLKRADTGDIVPIKSDDLEVISSLGAGYIRNGSITKNSHIIEKYKVIVGYGITSQDKVITVPKILKPHTVCTLTYCVFGASDSLMVAENIASYLKTRFVRFLIKATLVNATITVDNLVLVPLQDFSHPWTDQMLYDKYGLTQDEIDYIEATIKPME